MIKTLVLDVDGVINGSIIGINSPFPSDKVTRALQNFKNNGGTIILCTSKGVYPIVEMVEKLNIGGIHITDAGGIIFDSQNNSYTLDNLKDSEVKNIIDILEATGNYFEVYTSGDWYILDKFHNKYIKAHSDLLRREPVRIPTFKNFDKSNSVSKFIYFTEENAESDTNTKLCKSLSDFAVKWTISPVLHPANLLIITKKGISKQSALQKISKDHSIDLNYALGVGDHHSDWAFMSICGYKGIMGNSTPELMEITQKENQETIAFGKSVDEDGILDIFRHFAVT